MLNKKIALMGAAIAAMVSTGANAATQTATAEVKIVAAVTLTQTAGLDLGVVAATAAGGTVTLPNTSNTRTCVGVTCVGTAQRGTFSVAGATTGYVVLVTTAPTTSLTGAGAPMALALSPSLVSFTSTGAAQTFYVGGTLAVGANQVAGTYTGTYNVSADYQ
jgi:Mat/Ecp fimbriae major subunit